MEQELGGNIILDGFELDNQEMIIVKKIVGNYAKKIRNFSDYEELKLTMKSHLKAKNKHFELKVLAIFNGERAVAEGTGRNPFTIIDDAMKKILQEIESRTGKEK